MLKHIFNKRLPGKITSRKEFGLGFFQVLIFRVEEIYYLLPLSCEGKNIIKNYSMII